MRAEALKLQRDLAERGLGLVIAADWYDPRIMSMLHYFDDSTGQELHCGVGGANVPAINQLLRPFGVAFSSSVYSGSYNAAGRSIAHSSGSAIMKFPAGGQVLTVPLKHITAEAAASKSAMRLAQVAYVSTLGFVQLPALRAGWVLALSDSSCLDDSRPHHKWPAKRQCVSLLADSLTHILRAQPNASVAGGRSPLRLPMLGATRPLKEALAQPQMPSVALTWEQIEAFNSHSRVLGLAEGCKPGNKSCRLPLVGYPRWRRGGSPLESTAQPRSMPTAQVSRASVLGQDADPLPLELLLPVPVGLLGMAIALWCLTRRRRRKPPRGSVRPDPAPA